MELLQLVIELDVSLLLGIGVVSFDLDLELLGLGLFKGGLSLIGSVSLVDDVVRLELLESVLFGSLQLLLDLFHGDGGVFMGVFKSLLDLGLFLDVLVVHEFDLEGDGVLGVLFFFQKVVSHLREFE